MAFVVHAPLARPVCNPASLSSRPPSRARAVRAVRRVAIRACDVAPDAAASPGDADSVDTFFASAAAAAADADAPAAHITEAQDDSDIDAVYAVWNTVAADEGIRPLQRDEADSAHTTTHLLARDAATGAPVGAARLVRDAQNARLDRVSVVPDARSRGVGRALVARLLRLAGGVAGATYVNAARGSEMAFYSILGFDVVGDERVEHGVIVRTMMLGPPVCAPAAGCVGLHHASIRVSDIEKSLAFYGSLGFIVSDKFLTSAGARACYVEGLGARLEFVEAPDGNGGLTGLQGVPPTGFDRLVFDVTKACTDLESFLQHLKHRNGGQIEIASAPAQQVLGKSVMSVAAISDPDGLPIEFFRREAQVPGEMRTRVSW